MTNDASTKLFYDNTPLCGKQLRSVLAAFANPLSYMSPHVLYEIDLHAAPQVHVSWYAVNSLKLFMLMEFD